MKNLNITVYFFYFIIGGLLFSFIHYAANTLTDPNLSAVISLLPLSIICGYIIYDKTILENHVIAIIPVIIITAFIAVILHLSLISGINKYIAITVSLILWFIFQYIRLINTKY